MVFLVSHGTKKHQFTKYTINSYEILKHADHSFETGKEDVI